jgi:TonB family protein
MCALLSLPGLARAEVAHIERGAPAKAKQRRALEQALARAAATAGVCFRRDVPERIRIDLEVEPGGRVGKSTHQDGGAIGQCLAGVLAVQTVPAPGARLTLRVAFDARTLAGGGIESALAPYQDKLRACKGDKTRGGRAVIRFIIQPDGRVLEPAIQESDLADERLERCLVDTMAKAKLGQGVVAKNVRYALHVAFPAGAAAAATGDSSNAAGGSLAPQPQKDGPHEGSDISAVMDRHKDIFNRCYAKQAKQKRALAGTVILRFTIRANGTVRNVKIKETTLNHAKVEQCIVEAGTKLRFPEAAGETRVFYPFAFSTK